MKSLNQETIEILSQTSLFKNIEERDINNMLDCLNPRKMPYSKGQVIANFGEPFTGIGIMLKGEAVIAKENIAGNRMIVTMIKKGDMFGEMISFSQLKTWVVTVTAQTDAEILFISPEKVILQCERLCQGHNQLIHNLLSIMSRKALLLNRKVEYLSIKSLRGKLSAYLLETQKQTKDQFFELKMNRDEMADFFNVARPSISRELGRMKDEGLIDFHKSTFRILDADRLRDFVE